MPGPPRKPTAIKIAEGNPGKRKLNRAEIGLRAQQPACPRWLDEAGRKIWKMLVEELSDTGVLRRLDQIALSNLCDAYATMVSARMELGKLPADQRFLVKAGGGGIRQNPLVAVVNRQREIIHRLCSEFGMTPAARARILIDEMMVIEPAKSLEDLVAGGADDPRFAERPAIN